ncbi:SagB/ThcOx family dehydrogenase [Brevibacillus migulae]|uniref:SagB/ThcOx family dehydrogenase n=1 Tax=Brevibacillus migulae TaxID=1644114 RepID=UPI00143155D6|nr:SagB/ThcOx family dehydrogenase [Brevibacillus migulae]
MQTAAFSVEKQLFLAVDTGNEYVQLKQMPALPYMPLYAYASKLTFHDTDMYQIGVSTLREHAAAASIKRTLAAFLQNRSSSDPPDFSVWYEGIGLHGSGALAELAGCYQVLEQSCAADFQLNRQQSVRIVDWEAHFPRFHTVLRNMEDLSGTLALHKIEANGLPGVAAVLRLAGLPHVLGTLALGFHLSAALERAVEQLLHAFSLYTYQQDAGIRPTAAWCSTPKDAWAQEASSEELAVPWTMLSQQYPPMDIDAELVALKQTAQRNGWSLHSVPLTHELLDELHLHGVSVRLDQLPMSSSGYEDSFWFLPQECPLLPSMKYMPDGRQDTELSRLYHENSKIHEHQRPDDFIFPPSLIDPHIQRVISNGVKDFRYAPVRVKLPDVRERRTVPIEEAILRRRSTLPLAAEPMTLEELSHLLYFSYGVTAIARNRQEGIVNPLRAAPSGGALYPVDVYLLIEHVEEVPQGMYYYHPHEHELLLVSGRYRAQDVKDYVNASHRLEKAACTLFFVGNFRRNQWKYRERGYRIVNLDCGHLGENFILVSSGLGLVAHGLMGFTDDYFNRLLQLDGSDEALLYMMCVGRGTH